MQCDSIKDFSFFTLLRGQNSQDVSLAKITSEREDAREEDREKRGLTSLKVITLVREKHRQSKVRE